MIDLGILDWTMYCGGRSGIVIKTIRGGEVCKIVEAQRSSSCFTSILEKTIRACDIVIFVDYFLDGAVNFDLTNIFTGYKGNKKLYMDAPIHTTKWGNQLIASYIVSEIIEPHMAKLENHFKELNEILHIGEPCQLTYGASEELEKYLD